MTNMIAKAGAAALIAIASLTATVSTASAGGHGHGSGAGFSIQFGNHGKHDRHKGHNGHNRHQVRKWAACAPRHAVKKARWNGLHRAHIQRVSPNRVVVAGYRHHRHDRMVFANVPGCPLIRR